MLSSMLIQVKLLNSQIHVVIDPEGLRGTYGNN